jgi:hypothetical protein
VLIASLMLMAGWLGQKELEGEEGGGEGSGAGGRGPGGELAALEGDEGAAAQKGKAA